MKEPLRNKKGVIQTDGRGQELYVGQPVLIMNTSNYKGGRGTVSTGMIVGFDRYVIVLKDFDKGMIGEGDVEDYAKFLEADKSKDKSWKYMHEGLKLFNLHHLRSDKIASEHLIGCTQKVRKGWIDGSLFTE